MKSTLITKIALLQLRIEDVASSEESRINFALNKHNNNRVKSAEFLGMNLRTFHRRMKDYGLNEKKYSKS